MTGTQTLEARAALGLAAAAGSLLLLRIRPLFTLPARTFDRLVLTAYIVSRGALFALVFLVLRIPPRGDIPSYYLPEGRAALAGLLPYRDFPSSYGPLHPYLDAIILRVWNSPVALIGFALLIELATLALFLHLVRRRFPAADISAGKQDRPGPPGTGRPGRNSETRLRTAGLLYLASPISLQFVCIDGQDNVLLALLLGLALLAASRVPSRTSDTLSGAAAGLGASLLKVLALFYAPVFFLAHPRRLRWAAGFALALLLGYGFFVVLRLPLLVPVQIEASMKQAGDLPFLVESVTGLDLPGKLLDWIMLAGVAAIYLAVARAAHATNPAASAARATNPAASAPARVRITLFALPAVTLVIELLAKKSWPPYLVIVLFPLALLVAGAGRWAAPLFALFSVVAVTEHSYWASILGSLTSADMHTGLLAHQPGPWLYALAQILLLAGYTWLLWLSLRAIKAPKR